MSNDVERLRKFTPAAGRLDRDEVLFRAGRASARTPRGWKVSCGVLAVSQAATLGLWWGTRPTPPVPPMPPAVVVPDAVPAPLPAPSGPAPVVEPSSYLALSRSWNPDAPPPPAPPSGPSRPERPLTAGARGDLFN